MNKLIKYFLSPILIIGGVGTLYLQLFYWSPDLYDDFGLEAFLYIASVCITVFFVFYEIRRLVIKKIEWKISLWLMILLELVGLSCLGFQFVQLVFGTLNQAIDLPTPSIIVYLHLFLIFICIWFVVYFFVGWLNLYRKSF